MYDNFFNVIIPLKIYINMYMFLIALSGKMQKVVKHADLKVQREGSI